MKAVGVQYSLTHGQKEALKKDYTQNIKLYIKDFAQEHIEKLRGEVEQNAMSGYRAKELEERLRVKYGASRSKAKFLAKQETSLFMSKSRRERFLDAGVEFYRWDSLGDRRVRPDHRKLNGRIFQFGDPPVSDSSTGKRAEPGEDFGCRCRAVALVGKFHKVGGEWKRVD
jgi:SPP1 gp7 family putative phage head morphogenesis protein